MGYATKAWWSLIYLAVISNDDVLESGEVCWTYAMEKLVAPKRQPERASDGFTGWKIDFEKRRVMGSVIMDMIESDGGHGHEELSCFFCLVGIGRRWADNPNVEWWLVRTAMDGGIEKWFRK